CRFFNTPAGCRRGNRCNFLHTPSPLAVAESAPCTQTKPALVDPPPPLKATVTGPVLCEVCGVEVDAASMVSHVNGRKHRNKALEMKLQKVKEDRVKEKQAEREMQNNMKRDPSLVEGSEGSEEDMGLGFHSLPNETLLHIFALLTLGDLLALALVNRHWHS